MAKIDKYKHLREKVARDVQNKPGKASQRRVTEERVIGKPAKRN